MCIINNNVDNISTKILAFPSKDGKRQFTVYSNTLSNLTSNLICIPVPNPQSLRFENIDSDIFNQCGSSFQNTTNKTTNNTTNDSYTVTFINSINDLHQSGLKPGIIAFLKTSYPTFGFLLLTLKMGNITYTPFAYSHDIQNKLFFPTKQYMELDWFHFIWSFFNQKVKWNYELYSANTPIICHKSSKHMLNVNNINWSTIPYDFCLGFPVILRCNENNENNSDIEMPFEI